MSIKALVGASAPFICSRIQSKFTMKFTVVTFVIAALFAQTTKALWCCCGLDKNSEACCKNVMGADTFYSPKCGLINGQTCDVGPGSDNIYEYRKCCEYREGHLADCF
ncbi:hypothetical protein FRC08_011688 [Ceratobasidium sp. 394]|nr:hypothetical protein FRC08_011688 [Ceratobasidium sp. 394]